MGTTKDDDDSDDGNDHDGLKKRQDITAPLNTATANATFEGMSIYTYSKKYLSTLTNCLNFLF